MGASQSQPNEESIEPVPLRREHEEPASDDQTKTKTKTPETGNYEPNLMRSKTVLLQSKPRMKLPHKCEEILKEADSPVDMSSQERLEWELYKGVLLDHGRKMYSLDHEASDGNSFMLFAKALSITWSEEPRYWIWLPQHISRDKCIEVAQLVNVCWLEVHGKFETKYLSPGILYKVSFVVMLKETAYGWDVPVNIRLVLPNGNKIERRESLLEKPRDKWVEIPVGEFMASEREVGEMEFSMFEYQCGEWKKGLVIKGVSIKATGSHKKLSHVTKF